MSFGVDIPPRLLAYAAVAGPALAALACLAFAAPWSVRLLAAGTAAYVVLSLFLHPRHSVLRDPFAIHNLSRVSVLVGCVFSALFVASERWRQNEELILLVLVIALISVLIADLGNLFVPAATPSPIRRRDPSAHAALLVCLTFFALGWLWRTYALSHGLLQGTLLGTRLELTGASNTYGTLNGMATIAMWGCVVFADRPRRILPLVAMEIAWLLITGSKAASVSILLPFAMVLYHRRLLRVDLRFVALVVLLLAVFVGSFVVIHGYRVAVARQISEVGYVEFDPIRAAGDIELAPDDFELVGQALAGRLNFAERFLLILESERRTPRPAWHGSSYLTALMWPIPRAVWPDKPSMSLGRYFATEYLGWGDESRSEAGITLWGEGFRNFGIAGALLSPALWMIFLQGLYSLAMRAGRWGLFYVAAAYMVMANSLPVNVALPVASLSQLAAVLLLFRAGTAVVAALARLGKVQVHG
ncbi:MAG: hypothetical protein R6X25_11950 [Candidatus Krumholzibacteriia bacterium]